MGPSRVELASQDPGGLVAHAYSARDDDIIVRYRKSGAVQTKALSDLPLEPVALNAIHPGLDGNPKPGTGAGSGKTEKNADPEAPDFAALEELQILGAEANPRGFGKIHP